MLEVRASGQQVQGRVRFVVTSVARAARSQFIEILAAELGVTPTDHHHRS